MENDPVLHIKDKILKSGRIAITSHLRPDGDSISTGLALFYMGQLLGKEMAVINEDETPIPFNLLHGADEIKIGQIPSQGFDLVILLECANVSRSGQKKVNNYFKINIDHHHSNDYYADINWVLPQASAVAEMVYTLGERLNLKFTAQIADLLYCGIVSDTGSFQFSNTTARSFEVCSHLIKKGATPTRISELLFHNNPPEKIKLLGKVLSTLQMNEKNNIAIITMFKKDLQSLNLDKIDTEDITSLARSIKDVQVVLFYKEIEKDKFRVSVRSKGNADAAWIAEHFGGGGHFHAAGFTAVGKYKELIKEIPIQVDRLITQIQSKSKAKKFYS